MPQGIATIFTEPGKPFELAEWHGKGSGTQAQRVALHMD